MFKGDLFLYLFRIGVNSRHYTKMVTYQSSNPSMTFILMKINAVLINKQQVWWFL